jgi:hypothetical protein
MVAPAAAAPLDGVKGLEGASGWITADEARLAQLLVAEGQAHLFAGWAAGDADVEKKRAFFEQVRPWQRAESRGRGGHVMQRVTSVGIAPAPAPRRRAAAMRGVGGVPLLLSDNALPVVTKAGPPDPARHSAAALSAIIAPLLHPHAGPRPRARLPRRHCGVPEECQGAAALLCCWG